MSNRNIENLVKNNCKITFFLAILVAMIGIFCFSIFHDKSIIVRLIIIFSSICSSVIFLYFSEPGKHIIGFSKDSFNELKRVTWATRRETIQMTGIVFVFVIVMGVFMGLLDKVIEFTLYHFLLGWK
ncbi:MAG: preprotein translocase subunit SecE [Bordetella sp.]|nr:MAG: preprotein translocase subunit SecE [Bordetella sp.]